MKVEHTSSCSGMSRHRGISLPSTRPLLLPKSDTTTSVYFQLADDRLRGLLPDEVSEAQLKARYQLTTAQLQAVLGRIAQ